MPTYIVRVADDFIRPRTEEYEIEADDPKEAETIALQKRGLGFVTAVREKGRSRLQMEPLELAIMDRDDARTEALALRRALENLIAYLDRPTTTPPEPVELVEARWELRRKRPL